MATRLIRRACIAVFVCGIGGLIAASVAGNNNGVVLSIGGAIALAAIVLMAVNTVTVSDPADRIDAFVEAEDEEATERLAQRLEAQITRLVDQGADEKDVRALVRDARDAARAQSRGPDRGPDRGSDRAPERGRSR